MKNVYLKKVCHPSDNFEHFNLEPLDKFQPSPDHLLCRYRYCVGKSFLMYVTVVV